jgi:hypothetical protein
VGIVLIDIFAILDRLYYFFIFFYEVIAFAKQLTINGVHNRVLHVLHCFLAIQIASHTLLLGLFLRQLLRLGLFLSQPLKIEAVGVAVAATI